MHAADRNTNCVQHNKTHVDKSARCRANSRPRTHTMTENGARVSEPRHVTETQNRAGKKRKETIVFVFFYHKLQHGTRTLIAK